MAVSPGKKASLTPAPKSALLAQALQEVSQLSQKRQDTIALQILDIIHDKPDPTIQRYQDLVEYKYTRGLSEDETAELKRLDAELEKGDEEFYAPILARLRHLAGR